MNPSVSALLGDGDAVPNDIALTLRSPSALYDASHQNMQSGLRPHTKNDTTKVPFLANL